VAIDGAEGGSGLDAGGGLPGSPCAHGAGRGVRAIRQSDRLGFTFLVRFRSSEHDAQPVVVLGKVLGVDADQFAAP
jgi:hypothetical protein